MYTSDAAWTIVVPERMNIGALLKYALANGYRDDKIITATLDYTFVMHYRGEASEDLVIIALDGNDQLASAITGKCHRCLGVCYLSRDRLDEAEKSFIEAYKLYLQTDHVLGQANTLNDLGRLQVRQDRLDEAEKSFLEASELSLQIHDVLGQANALNDLGRLQMRRGRLDEAEKSFLEAYKLSLQSDRILGRANTLNDLGRLQMRRDRLDEAEKSFLEASELSLQIHDVLGQANALNEIRPATDAAGSSGRGREVFPRGFQAVCASS